MATLRTSAKIVRPSPLRDQVSTVLSAAGLFWSVTGEFTTPGLGQAPRFQATDIRLINTDGSETSDMQDNLHADFVAHLEDQAVESLAEDRAQIRLCDVIDAARCVA